MERYLKHSSFWPELRKLRSNICNFSHFNLSRCQFFAMQRSKSTHCFILSSAKASRLRHKSSISWVVLRVGGIGKARIELGLLQSVYGPLPPVCKLENWIRTRFLRTIKAINWSKLLLPHKKHSILFSSVFFDNDTTKGTCWVWKSHNNGQQWGRRRSSLGFSRCQSSF